VQTQIAIANDRAAYRQFRHTVLGVSDRRANCAFQYAQLQQQVHLLQARVGASRRPLALVDVERTLLSAQNNIQLVDDGVTLIIWAAASKSRSINRAKLMAHLNKPGL
jgi:hypothetical protein